MLALSKTASEERNDFGKMSCHMMPMYATHDALITLMWNHAIRPGGLYHNLSDNQAKRE